MSTLLLNIIIMYESESEILKILDIIKKLFANVRVVWVTPPLDVFSLSTRIANINIHFVYSPAYTYRYLRNIFHWVPEKIEKTKSFKFPQHFVISRVNLNNYTSTGIIAIK